ncbi:hypothetical protein [Propylenella binzhouense]|uniref:DUF5678 domain-containing protein n=1 Tax=Propylenella binzhouense TaxID=2555902 RepID=A0A964T3U5_9HYPH|nr:hypothetical protein [Propylenella binzhouense]MYZ47986.1 hypothetical protein [Propylenella binzhouense]
MAKLLETMTHDLEANARRIHANLRDYADTASVFSSDSPRLIDSFEGKWVGVYHGKVAAAADSLEEVAEAMAAKGIPLGESMIRRIDRDEKTLIL